MEIIQFLFLAIDSEIGTSWLSTCFLLPSYSLFKTLWFLFSYTFPKNPLQLFWFHYDTYLFFKILFDEENSHVGKKQAEHNGETIKKNPFYTEKNEILLF